ncbi:MAG: aminoacyl-tRNA hydrolase [Lactobacillaceae bacterium]|jgi:PTH1 family peptidyl-tRNA hydrolase|nr:aminoacyl-tRNA hydrolase [Lactobacillaceae bacterium]
MTKIKLIIGLGNIGIQYSNNRHNIGFITIDQLAYDLKTTFKLENKLHGFLATTKIDDQTVYLLKPTTMMNDSGKAVKAVMNYFNIGVDEIAVIVDDIDRPYGALKIKKNGSSGGHNGLKSIADHIGTEEFIRVRIGVDRPAHEHNAVIKHVLGDFTKEQFEIEKPTILNAADASHDLLMGKALNFVTNKYNK